MSPKISSKATFVLAMYFICLGYPACVTCASYSSSSVNCPRDALKLGICANVLGLVGVAAGAPPTIPCCTLLAGLADLEAAICLCTAIRANVLGYNLNVPVSLSLLLGVCAKPTPSGFNCA